MPTAQKYYKVETEFTQSTVKAEKSSLKKALRSKYVRWIHWLLFALLLLGLILDVFLGTSEAPTSDIASARVNRGTIEQVVSAQGTVEPKDSVAVGARVTGELKKLHVDVGDEVKATTLLAEIDAKLFESQVAGDEARLKTLQAQKQQIESELQQAERVYIRNKQLIADHAISQESLEDSQTARDIKKAQLLSLEAQIEEATSTLEGNRANLSYTKIYAPIDGTVISKTAKEGETLNANQVTPTILEIADLDIVTVTAEVAEADINKIEVEMPVTFTTLGSLGRKWSGKVRQILPAPEIVNDVVLYHVLVDIENKDRKLMRGMTTQMFFQVGYAENDLIVPSSALVRSVSEGSETQGRPYIVRVRAGKDIIEKTVTVGLSNRSSVQILSGLNEGDEVVVSSSSSSITKKSERKFSPPARL